MTHESRSLYTTSVGIGGMHCVNCDVAVERALKNLPGITRVRANFRTSIAVVTSEQPLDMEAVSQRLAEEGYALAGAESAAPLPSRRAHYLEVGGIVLIFAALFFAARQFGYVPRGFNVSEGMSYGLVFLIGLVASVSSCIAVTGGLLVAVTAKYNEISVAPPGWPRFKPLVFFNAGRLLSYTLLGGLVGLLGSVLTLSNEVNGILTLVASGVMILLGLSMLDLFPHAGRWLPRLPKAFSHAIHDLAVRNASGGAFVLGAATFFLPCGFTQALQLYVLAKGDFTTGALTMFAFALGTLPALLSLSALASFARGAFRRRFLAVAGVAVIFLGILNIQYGFVLTGSNAVMPPAVAQAADIRTVRIENGKQVAIMRVVDFSYEPSEIVVRQGIPVEWRIDASEAAGCGRVLLAPSLGIRTILSDKATSILAFTPQQPGEYPFNCGMGMMTPGAKITVLPAS
jgi:sulfite exporter TauE/SafE/copper chaperone CopZ